MEDVLTMYTAMTTIVEAVTEHGAKYQGIKPILIASSLGGNIL
jgi:hypothetical protein